MALNMTWMQRRPKRAVRNSPSLRREVPAIIAAELPTARRLGLLSLAEHGETPGVDVGTFRFGEHEDSAVSRGGAGSARSNRERGYGSCSTRLVFAMRWLRLRLEREDRDAKNASPSR